MNQLVAVALTPGMRLYKYQLIHKIGAGSFGEVWLARDLAVQRDYAVKILQPGISVDARLHEAQIGNQLEHNNLVYVHQADVIPLGADHAVILAMDYMPHGSVETLANSAGYLPLPDVLRIARDILQGLQYLHSRSFYHNDIKPGNILLGPQHQAMLSDYGITGVSVNGAPVAAPAVYVLHRAPEVQATGNIGVSSDIFQVGMTIARLLIHLDHLRSLHAQIGSAQFDLAVASGKLLQAKDFGCHIPAAVRRVVLKAVHPDPAQRYASALEMRRALERLDYPGHWTVNSSGSEIGRCGDYEFIFSATPILPGKFDVECSKRKLSSGHSQRITRFCERSVTRKRAESLVTQFKQFVVTGK